jgi:hypothetical protein
MENFLRWFNQFQASTDWQTTFAGAAVIVSLLALWYSHRSSGAAEVANKHAAKSADAAEVSSTLARASFENEAKSIRASAYWALYRIHVRLLNFQKPRPENCDLSPVQTLLAVYPYTLTPEAISKMQIALNAMEDLMAAAKFDRDDAEKVRFAVRDAAMILHEEWMAIGAIQDDRNKAES